MIGIDMSVAAELLVLIRAKDEASATLDSIAQKGGGMSKAIGVAAAASGAALGAMAVKGVMAAGDLQQAVANISTIKPEIDTKGVFNALNEMQTRVPQTAAQLGESLYDIFSSMDVGQKEAIDLVETFARGATGAGTSAQVFGTSVMGVMNAYKLSASDAAHVSDVFFNTVNKGVVTGQELASSLGPVTQSAKAAGVSLDELGGLIAGVTKEGGPAAQNINNLNNFLQKVTTKDAQAAIEGLGVKTKTATGDFRPILDVLGDMKPKLEKMTESARANALQAIFPDAQARIGAMTLLSQLDAVREAVEANKTEAGSAASAYEKMSATFNSQMKLLQNTFMSVLTQVGAQILPLITPVITAFGQLLPAAFHLAGVALTPLALILTPIIHLLGDMGAVAMDILGFGKTADAFVAPFLRLPGPIQSAMSWLANFVNATRDVTAVVAAMFGQGDTVDSWIAPFMRLPEPVQNFLKAVAPAVDATKDFLSVLKDIAGFGKTDTAFVEPFLRLPAPLQAAARGIADVVNAVRLLPAVFRDAPAALLPFHAALQKVVGPEVATVITSTIGIIDSAVASLRRAFSGAGLVESLRPFHEALAAAFGPEAAGRVMAGVTAIAGAIQRAGDTIRNIARGGLLRIEDLLGISHTGNESIGAMLVSVVTTALAQLRTAIGPAAAGLWDTLVAGARVSLSGLETAIAAVSGWVQTHWGSIVGTASAIWAGVVAGAEAVLPVIQSVISFMGSHVGSIAAAVGGAAAAIAGVLGAVAGWELAMGALGAVAGPILAVIGSALGAILSPIGLIAIAAAALAVAWQNDWGGIQEKTAAVAGVIQDVLGAAISFVASHWGEFKSAAETTIDFIIEHWEALGVVLAAVTGGVVAVALFELIAHFGEVKDVAGTVVEFIRDHWGTISSVAESVWSGIVSVVSSVIDEVTSKVAMVADFVRDHWSDIESIAQSAFEGVRGIVTEVIEFVTQEFGRVVDFVRENWSQIGEAVRNVLTVITVVVGAIVLAAIALWHQFGDDIIAVTRIAWETVKGVLDGALQVILGVFKVAISVLTGDWSGAWDGIKMIVSGAWEIIASIVRGGVDTVVQIITGIGGALGSLAGILIHAGEQMIEGLISGIRGMAGRAKDAAMEVVNGAKDAVLETLHINSPSLVWAKEVGEPITEGIAHGIKGKADLARDAALSVVDESLTTARTASEEAWRLAAVASDPMRDRLRDLQGEYARVHRALLEAKVELLNTDPYSARAAAIKGDIQILDAWEKKTKDAIDVIKSFTTEQKVLTDAVSGFVDAQAAAANAKDWTGRFGVSGAGVMGALSAAFESDTPAAGQKLFDTLDKMVAGLKGKIPDWQTVGQELIDAFATAISERTPEAIDAAMNLLRQLNDTVVAQTSLTGANYQAGLQKAFDAQAITDTLGSSLGGAFATLRTAIETNSGGALDAAVKVGAGVQAELKKLPDFIRGQIGADFASAMTALTDAPSVEAADNVERQMARIHQAAGIIPAGFQSMVAPAQAAVRELVAAADSGAISWEDAGKRMQVIARAVPADWAELPPIVRQTMESLRQQFESGSITAEDYQKRMAALTSAAKADWADLPPAVQSTMAALDTALSTGTISTSDYQKKSAAVLATAKTDWSDLPVAARAALTMLDTRLTNGTISLKDYQAASSAATSIISKDYDLLSTGVKADLDRIEQALGAGTISGKDAERITSQITSVMGKDWGNLAASVQDRVDAIAQAVQNGTLTAAQGIQALVGVTKWAGDQLDAEKERVKAVQKEMQDAEAWFKEHGYGSAYPGAGASSGGGGGGGGGSASGGTQADGTILGYGPGGLPVYSNQKWGPQVGGSSYNGPIFKDRGAGGPSEHITYNSDGTTTSQWYANGGDILEHIVGIGLSTGTRYHFGEEGPERVYNKSQLADASKGGGGAAIDYAQLGAELAKALSGVALHMDGRKVGEIVGEHDGRTIELNLTGVR